MFRIGWAERRRWNGLGADLFRRTAFCGGVQFGYGDSGYGLCGAGGASVRRAGADDWGCHHPGNLAVAASGRCGGAGAARGTGGSVGRTGAGGHWTVVYAGLAGPPAVRRTWGGGERNSIRVGMRFPGCGLGGEQRRNRRGRRRIRGQRRLGGYR